MDELDPQIRDRISRRRMIKRLGAATAVAWTAPVLSTLGKVPALSAQQACADCAPVGSTGDQACDNQPDCGVTEPSGNPCSCLRNSAGTCQCHSCVFCDNPAVVSCTSPAGCPAGWICAISCCSDPTSTTDFVCQPACGAGDNPAPCVGQAGIAARSGRTSMGVQ